MTPFVESTPTPPPFPVRVIATSVYYPGVPDEYGYTFANPDDLRAARRVYAEYFDLLSFREAPPPPTDELTRQLTRYRVLDPNPALNVPMNGRSCSINDVLSVLQRSGQASQYYRINAEPLQWSEDHTFLRLNSSGVSLHSDWKTNALVQLVERDTGRTIREKQMVLLGTASLTILDDGWIVVGESDGFYCDKVDSFDR